MKIKLFYNKTVYENASYYFNLSKKIKKKLEGALNAIKELEKKINISKKEHKRKIRKNEMLKKRMSEQKWFEKYFYSLTYKKRLMIGGRNAQENDLIVRKYLEKDDLFFHSVIHGGSVVILKDGLNADERELLECAQFTVSYSNYWKERISAGDIFYVKKDQISKTVKEGHLKTGGFGIEGNRKYMKNIPLGLKIGLNEKDNVIIVPAMSKLELKNVHYIGPNGRLKKGEIAKKLANVYSVHPDFFLQHLPSGLFHYK